MATTAQGRSLVRGQKLLRGKYIGWRPNLHMTLWVSSWSHPILICLISNINATVAATLVFPLSYL